MCRWTAPTLLPWYKVYEKKRTNESVKRSCTEVKNKLNTGFVDVMLFMVHRPHRRTELIQHGQCDNRGRYTVPINNCIVIHYCLCISQWSLTAIVYQNVPSTDHLLPLYITAFQVVIDHLLSLSITTFPVVIPAAIVYHNFPIYSH